MDKLANTNKKHGAKNVRHGAKNVRHGAQNVRHGAQNRDVARLKSLQNSGAFRELLWVLLTKTENLCAIF